jgi:hypothetical protein
MDGKQFASGLMDVAKAMVPLLPLGGPIGGAAELVVAAFDLVDANDAKVVGFEAARDEFEAAVSAHADRTAASLG